MPAAEPVSAIAGIFTMASPRHPQHGRVAIRDLTSQDIMATAAEKRDQLRGLMKGIDIAMFTTWGESGFPVSRPLSTQEVEFDGKVLWFFTRRSSAKVEEIRRNPKVNVAYASKERNVYLSVAGTAEAIADQALIDVFWNDAMKAFFAGGRTDPDLVLLKVTVHTVEYWDGPSPLLGKAIAFVISRVECSPSTAS